MSGLELVTKPDSFKAIVIKSVLPNYPAAEAGLREGDEIISINGRPIAQFDLDKLVRMFKQDGKACHRQAGWAGNKGETVAEARGMSSRRRQ